MTPAPAAPAKNTKSATEHKRNVILRGALFREAKQRRVKGPANCSIVATLRFPNQHPPAPYFPAATNAFTTILFGCTPTGIMVSREYSLGSSFVAFRR